MVYQQSQNLEKSWLALQLAVDLVRVISSSVSQQKSAEFCILIWKMHRLLHRTGSGKFLMVENFHKKNLFFWHDSNIMGEGFEADLIEFLEYHPDVKLVIIDVFQEIQEEERSRHRQTMKQITKYLPFKADS